MQPTMSAVGEAPRRGWPWHLGAVLLVAFYCLGRYGDAAADFYFLDDFWLLRTAQGIKAGSAQALFEIFRPTHAGFLLYRPFTQTGYMWLLVSLFGFDSGAAHAFQVTVFAVNAVLVLAIASRHLGSLSAGLCAALLYAAAPGHGAAVYWLAAFSMTGAALSLFLLVWWWGWSAGRVRAVGCSLLQVIALLCGEYGVAGPGLILAVAAFGALREPWRRVARDAAGPVVIVLIYGIAKLAYFTVRGPSSFGYGVTAAPDAILTSLGHYTLATLNLLTFAVGAAGYLPAAATVLALALVSALLALRGRAAWRPVALGTAIFVVGLTPVLALAKHYYDFFIGVAGLGAAIACVGLARLLAAGRNVGAVVLAVIVLASDARTGDAAMRNNGIAALVRNTARADETLLLHLDDLATANGRETVYVMPRTPMMASMFADGNAHEIFFAPPLRVRLYDTSIIPTPRDGEIVVETPPALTAEQLAATGFARAPRFAALRAGLLRLHSAYDAIEGMLAR